jgi:hypothetical protein
MYTLKIKVTKQILLESAMCGVKGDAIGVAQNCAFARAVQCIFPNAFVGGLFIHPNTTPEGWKEIGRLYGELSNKKTKESKTVWDLISLDKRIGQAMCEDLKMIPTTFPMSQFISRFDHSSPLERLEIPEEEFELPIPDYVIETINIDEIKGILASENHLELVES